MLIDCYPQPVLSESMLEQFQSSPELVPAGLAAEMYLEILVGRARVCLLSRPSPSASAVVAAASCVPLHCVSCDRGCHGYHGVG